MLGLASVLSLENWLHFEDFGLYSFSIVLLHCVDSGFCYNPLENIEVSVLPAITVVRSRLQAPSLLQCVAGAHLSSAHRALVTLVRYVPHVCSSQ